MPRPLTQLELGLFQEGSTQNLHSSWAQLWVGVVVYTIHLNYVLKGAESV